MNSAHYFNNPLQQNLSFWSLCKEACAKLARFIWIPLLSHQQAYCFLRKQVYAAVDARNKAGKRINAWNHASAMKFLRFIAQQPWLLHTLSNALLCVQTGTQEAVTLEHSGMVQSRARIDKPWGWEIIGATVQQNGEGYTEKLLVIVGPLSTQVHQDYQDAQGAWRSAKVETQTSLGPCPYLLKIGEEKTAKIFTLLPGESFHVHKGTWHQPSVKPGDVVVVKEISKPNIGPGSTTRGFDPWKHLRTQTDF